MRHLAENNTYKKNRFLAKDILLLSLIILLTISLLLVGIWSNGIIILNNLSNTINQQILYQSVTLFITTIFLFILRRFKKTEFRKYFRKGNISAKISPVPIIGINPKPGENWFHLGRNFTIIISAVTTIIIYFQLIRESGTSIGNFLHILPFSVVFALSNSFVEESITRLGVVIVLKGNVNDRNISLISAVIFGTVHYWGNPGGLIGVLAAGFLGWFLAKSIIETNGIFWAWFIHFVQDVIIFSALLSIQ